MQPVPRRRILVRGACRQATLLLALLGIAACRAAGIDELPAGATQTTLTNPLTVITWNTEKETGADLRRELASFLDGCAADLVFLQEYSEELSGVVAMGGHFAHGWRYPWPDGTTIGVTTLSPVRPTAVRSLPTTYREFFVTAPKVSLLTTYPLDDGRSLLAVNVHLLIFERWGTLKLRSQLAGLEAAIADHEGPVIVAGDVNTWNERRFELVSATMRRLGLREVAMFDRKRTTGDMGPAFLDWLFGVSDHLPLDRVYYRGLSVRSATVLPSEASDHHALVVDFVLSR